MRYGGRLSRGEIYGTATQPEPTRGSAKSIIVSHDKIMMFARPFGAVATRTTDLLISSAHETRSVRRH
jgi:hypothetical protein